MTMYQIVPMMQTQAELIANTWRYEGIYAFYDMDQDEEDMAEFLDFKAREGKVFVVMQREEVIGFCSIQLEEEEAEIGLGMRPDLTGKGLGQKFVSYLVHYIIGAYHPERISLAVAAFNKRAITLYERIGFRHTESFDQQTNGSVYPFIRMVLEIKNLSS
ncbi:GNAT family N-acetyltransferase [Terribacillus saccharophilus]|uniref:GNAT family N-acetyltransferase n=1 Tax=Terribacillus saccharophilus TaxID=361277 RepID=UPI003982C399